MGSQHSNAVSPFYLDELQLDADLLMGNGKFTDVSFIRARVSLLYLSVSKVAGKLDMSRLHVDQSLIMFEKAEFASGAAKVVSSVVTQASSRQDGRSRSRWTKHTRSAFNRV
jgi:hypothetical protein